MYQITVTWNRLGFLQKYTVNNSKADIEELLDSLKMFSTITKISWRKINE